MNRRLFLGQASALATLALPGAAQAAQVTKAAPQTETKLILSYIKAAGAHADTDFRWVNYQRYIAIETEFIREGALKSVACEKTGGKTEYHFVFRDNEALSRYLGVLANMASPKERAAAGFELEVRVV